LSKINLTNSKIKLPTFLSVFISLLFVGLSAVLVINSVKSVVSAYRRMLLLDQAKQEVGELRVQNLELKQEKEKILSEDYVEKEARDRLYYVKDGEVMVVLPETNEELKDQQDVKGVEDIHESEDSLREEWIKIIQQGI
jgi:cell division protein FtsB